MAKKNIQEYIQRDDGTQGTLLIPDTILPTMIDEVDKALIPRELAAMVIGPGQFKGSDMSVNLETDNTMDIRQVGEGAEVPLDQASYESVTLTPKKYGVAIRITREMMEDSQFELLKRQIRIAGKRFAEKETELILTQLDDANATTTGGAQATIANINESINDLESNDFEATDIIIGDEFYMDLRNIDTFVEADKSGSNTLRTGNIGGFLGMQVHRFSRNAAPSATYAKYAYVIDRSYAYAIAIARDLTVEQFNMATYDMQGAVATMRIAVENLKTKAASKITTT